MKRVLPHSLAALALIVALAMALSLSFTPTLAQDGVTPTPDTAGAGADTGQTGAGDLGAQPEAPIFIGGDETSPVVQTVLTYFQTFDPNLLAENVEYRDYTQPQGLTTREDVTGAANYLNTAFTNQEYTIRRVLTAENTVVVEFDFSGTNTGVFMGAEPTQQTVTVPMVAIIELSAPATAAPEGETAEGEAAAGDAAEGETTEGEAAQGAETGQTDMTTQAAQQIVRFDLYYDASLLAQQLGFTLQAPVAAQPGETGETTGETGETGETGDMGETTGEDATGLAPAIVIENQPIAQDGTVLVARVVSPVNGWVDIHADSSGAPGTVIGYAQIAAGETLNVPVPVDGSRVTATLWAMLHEDAGQLGVHEFPGPDAPVTDAQGNVIAMPFAVGEPGESGQAAAQTVDVSLVDGQIQMPTTLAPGAVVFNVTNSGTMEHSFAIEGQGLEAALPANLQPGESAQLEVELQAGTYEVYCPVADHAETGMRLQVTVQ